MEFDSIYIVVLSFSIIAFCLILSLFILLCLMNSPKTYIYYLVINLLILNNLHSFSYLINWVKQSTTLLFDSNTLCQIQAFVMIFTSISNEFWASSIPLIYYLQNIKGEYYMKKKFKYYFTSFFILFNIVPLLLTLIFQRLDLLGINTLYCWVKSDKIMIQIIIYSLRWFNIILSSFFTLKIILYLCSISIISKEEKKKQIKYSVRLLLFPLIQLVGITIPAIYRGLQWVNSNIEVSWMKEAIVIMNSFQSILYPICFCLHSGMFSYINHSCRKEEEIDKNNALFFTNSFIPLKE